MQPILQKSISYINYFIHRKDQYSLHSPFAFELYNYLKSRNSLSELNCIRTIKDELLKNHVKILSFDLGAGSQINSDKNISVSKITSTTSIPHKFGVLLYKLVNRFQPKNIIELGTSTGISTLYLAKGSPAEVYTIEGNPALVKLAVENFQKANSRNITAITGNFDEQLPDLLNKLNKVDFAYIDGNHKLEPTLNYFKLLKEKSLTESILVFDDIHWSAEMERAWKEIINDKDVTLSIDFFRFGLVFFNKNLSKQHYILKI